MVMIAFCAFMSSWLISLDRLNKEILSQCATQRLIGRVILPGSKKIYNKNQKENRILKMHTKKGRLLRSLQLFSLYFYKQEAPLELNLTSLILNYSLYYSFSLPPLQKLKARLYLEPLFNR